MDCAERVKRHTIAVVVFALAARCALAADAVSSQFSLDLHYESSATGFPDGEVTEVWGESVRWSLLTTTLAADWDGDSLPDVWERFYGLDERRASAGEDPDGDGWTNLQEYNAGTNPVVVDNPLASVATSWRWVADTWIDSTAGGVWTLVEMWALSDAFTADTVGREPDSDGDGLPDRWERLYGLDEKVADAHLDPDGDGLTNLQEYNAGTNPMVAGDWAKASAVTDNPFVTDTRVYYTGGNPDFDEAFAVIRVSDGFICDTDGLYYDWDGDGIPNWWEKRFARDGSKTGLDAASDDDSDGMSNLNEFIAYTDPTDAKSKFVIGLEPIRIEPVKVRQTPFKLMAFSASANDAEVPQFKLVWQSVKGRTYGVFACSDLAKGWDSSPVATIEGTGELVEYVPPGVSATMFFRVSVKLTTDNKEGSDQ